jgi:hypothetical protein
VLLHGLGVDKGERDREEDAVRERERQRDRKREKERQTDIGLLCVPAL